jgi:signal peptidase
MNKKQVLKGIGVIIAITIIAYVGPGLLSGNTQILTVMSDSMSPAISAGDMVVIKTLNSDEINVGDIVTYAPRTYGIVITHRVIDIDENGNFVMKGDANEKNDISDIKPEQVIGRCESIIPYFGYVAHYIRQPIGFVILIVIPALLLLGIELKAMWMRRTDDT